MRGISEGSVHVDSSKRKVDYSIYQNSVNGNLNFNYPCFKYLNYAGFIGLKKGRVLKLKKGI